MTRVIDLVRSLKQTPERNFQFSVQYMIFGRETWSEEYSDWI